MISRLSTFIGRDSVLQDTTCVEGSELRNSICRLCHYRIRHRRLHGETNPDEEEPLPRSHGKFWRGEEEAHLYAEFANTLIHFADGIAGQRQTDRQEKRFFGPEGNQGNCRLKAAEEGERERGREGKVAIRIPISGSASHASA